MQNNRNLKLITNTDCIVEKKSEMMLPKRAQIIKAEGLSLFHVLGFSIHPVHPPLQMSDPFLWRQCLRNTFDEKSHSPWIKDDLFRKIKVAVASHHSHAVKCDIFAGPNDDCEYILVFKGQKSSSQQLGKLFFFGLFFFGRNS